MTDYNWRQFDIRIFAVIASLVISAFTILVPDTPNDDAFVYIRTAEIVLSDGIAAAFQHYASAGRGLPSDERHDVRAPAGARKPRPHK